MWYEAITHVFQWTTWIVPWCTDSWSKESKTWLYTHYTHTYIYIYIYIHTYTQTQCFPSVIKSSHARPMGSPWRIQGPMLTVPAGHRGGCFPWTCFMRLHVFSLGIRSFRKKKKRQGLVMGMWILGITATLSYRLISALHPNTTSSPGLWLKRLPVGGPHTHNMLEVILGLLMFALFIFYEGTRAGWICRTGWVLDDRTLFHVCITWGGGSLFLFMINWDKLKV